MGIVEVGKRTTLLQIKCLEFFSWLVKTAKYYKLCQNRVVFPLCSNLSLVAILILASECPPTAPSGSTDPNEVAYSISEIHSSLNL